MAGQNTLGGTYSLTGGLDLSPVKIRQENQRIQAAFQEAMAAQGNAAKSLTLQERKMDQDATALDRELTLRQKESEASRAQETHLALLQQQGRVDLQELLIAADSSRQTQALAAEEKARQETQEFEFLKLLEMKRLDAQSLNARLDEDARQFDATLKLEEARGNREGVRLKIDQEIAKIQTLKAERELDNIPSAEEAKAIRELDRRGAILSLKKMEMDMKAQRVAEPVLQAIRQTQLALEAQKLAGQDPASRRQDAETRALDAGTEKTKVETEQEALRLGMAKGMVDKTAASEAEKAKEGFVPDDMAAEGKVPAKSEKFLTRSEFDEREMLKKKVDAQSFFSTGFFESSGHELAINALNALEELGDNQSDESVDARKLLRKAKALAVKEGKTSFGTSYAIGQGENEKAFWKIVDELEDRFGIDIT